MSPRFIAIAAVLAAVAAYFVQSHGKKEVAEKAAPILAAPARVETPKPVAAVPPTPAPVAPKRKGIVVCPFAEGSREDASAPAQPTGTYARTREAALQKWRNATVDLTNEQTTIHEIVVEIERLTGLHVGLDAAVPTNSSISVSMSGTNGEEALGMIADVSGLSWVVDSDGASWLVPNDKVGLYETAEARELREVEHMNAALAAEAQSPGSQPVASFLDSMRISANLKDVTLNQAMGILASIHSVPLNWDHTSIPDSKAIKVSLDVTDATPREALKAMLEPVGLSFVEENGSAMIATREEIERRAALAVKVEEAKVVAKTTAADVEAGVLDRTVVIDGNELAIRDVAERVSKALGIGYVIDPATWTRAARYGFDGEPHKLREIFAALAKGAPVRVSYREGKFWFLAVPASK